MGNRSFVIEMKSEKDLKAIEKWLKNEDPDTDYGPYHCGSVTLGKRQFALLGCDGSYGVNALANYGFRAWSRLYSLDDPDFYHYLYQQIQDKGQHSETLQYQ